MDITWNFQVRHLSNQLDILQFLPTLVPFCISTKVPILVLSPISQPYRLTKSIILTPLPSFTSGEILFVGDEFGCIFLEVSNFDDFVNPENRDILSYCSIWPCTLYTFGFARLVFRAFYFVAGFFTFNDLINFRLTDFPAVFLFIQALESAEKN